DIAECVGPAAGDAGPAKSVRDTIQRDGALAQPRDESFLCLIVLEFRFHGVEHHLVEPGLIAFQQRTHGGRRLGERGLQRFFSSPVERVEIRFLAVPGGSQRVVLAAQSEFGWLEARTNSSSALAGEGVRNAVTAAKAVRRGSTGMTVRSRSGTK